MAERNEKVFQKVRDELGKKPEVGSRDLYQMAQEVDGAIAEDTLQQFHARYVLPIKREQSGSKGGRRSRRGKGGRRSRALTTGEAGGAGRARRGSAKGAEATRQRARDIFLEFARDFAEAESRSDIVQVLSRVDDYVDRIVAKAS